MTCTGSHCERVETWAGAWKVLAWDGTSCVLLVINSENSPKGKGRFTWRLARKVRAGARTPPAHWESKVTGRQVRDSPPGCPAGECED